MTTRLGYACINTTLQQKHKICCNRTCRLNTAIKQGIETGQKQGSPEYSRAIYDFLTEYGINNLTAMFKIISWSRKHNILFYRMSSDMFPHVANYRIKAHMTETDWKNYNSLTFATNLIHQIGAYSQKHGVRLTMHPGHYNQLGAKTSQVVENTIADLTWHGRLLQLLHQGAAKYNLYLEQNNRPGLPNIMDQSILCVHGGGTYGDKKATLERWVTNYNRLPHFVQSRLALENDERSYSAEDLLPICDQLKIPMIFDFHHYNCWAYYHEKNPTQLPISDLLSKILSTWEVRNMIPKFHLSDQDTSKKCGAHHDYVETIPPELLALMATQYKFDIMVEAKKKELATIKLQQKYKL